jgi:phage-related tail fiber protein
MPTKIMNGLDLQAQRITALGDPSLPTDAATKQYVDLFINGLTLKDPVRVTTTANITLSGAQTIDGVSVVAGNRVLVKNQTLPAENGIYVAAAGAWARSGDANVSAEVVPGMTVFVLEGTTQADRQFSITSDAAIVLGTTAITFGQTAGVGGTTLTAGNGISLPGNAITVVPAAGGGLLVGGTGVSIDNTFSGLARRFSTNVPNATSATITHSLGTLDVQVMVREITGGAVVQPDITLTDVNTVTLGFAVAPGVGVLRVTVLG